MRERNPVAIGTGAVEVLGEVISRVMRVSAGYDIVLGRRKAGPLAAVAEAILREGTTGSASRG